MNPYPDMDPRGGAPLGPLSGAPPPPPPVTIEPPEPPVLPPSPLPYPPAPLPSTPLSIPGTTTLPGSASIASLRTPGYARVRTPPPSVAPMRFGAGTPVVGGAGMEGDPQAEKDREERGGMGTRMMAGMNGASAGGFSSGGSGGGDEGFSGSNDSDLVGYIVKNLMARGGGR